MHYKKRDTHFPEINAIYLLGILLCFVFLKYYKK